MRHRRQHTTDMSRATDAIERAMKRVADTDRDGTPESQERARNTLHDARLEYEASVEIAAAEGTWRRR